MPGIQVLTWTSVADADKLDFVITFQSLHELLLFSPSLEEGNIISLGYNLEFILTAY